MVHGEESRTEPEIDVVKNIEMESCKLCTHCNKFISQEEIESHISTMHGYVFICGECGERFESTEACQVHMKLRHTANEKPKCTECRKVFQDEQNLKSHVIQYHTERKFPCNQCSLELSSYTDIVRHKMKEHEGSITSQSDVEEIFRNVVVAQQDIMLEKFFNLEAKIFDQLKELRKECVCKCNNSSELEQEVIKRVLNNIDELFKVVQPRVKDPLEENKVACGLKRMLIVGDTTSRSLNISVLKNVLNYDVKRIESNLIIDEKASPVISKVIKDAQVDTLVIQSGSKELTDLEIPYNAMDKIEDLKEYVHKTYLEMFTLAEKFLDENTNLNQVVLMKQPYRCDFSNLDPHQIRSKLRDFGNRVLDDLWLSRGCPKNIKIADQKLECTGDLRVARFGQVNHSNFDGIHYSGFLGVQHFTGSMINALFQVMNEHSTDVPTQIDLRLPCLKPETTVQFSQKPYLNLHQQFAQVPQTGIERSSNEPPFRLVENNWNRQ